MESGDIEKFRELLNFLLSKELNQNTRELVISRINSLPEENPFDSLLVDLSKSYEENNTVLQEEILNKISELLANESDLFKISEFSNLFFEEVTNFVTKSPDLNLLKNEILSILQDLKNAHYYWEENEEAELRPKLVDLQGIIEETIVRLLRERKINSVVGCIHTNLPATPLCVAEGNFEESIHESSRDNPFILYTVRSRAKIINEYLNSGSKLYTVYNSERLHERNEQQRQIFQLNIEKYTNLQEITIKSDVPDEVSGATYFIDLINIPGKFVFSINARQAIAESKKKLWKIFLGHDSDKIIQSRLDEVFEFFKSQKLDIIF